MTDPRIPTTNRDDETAAPTVPPDVIAPGGEPGVLAAWQNWVEGVRAELPVDEEADALRMWQERLKEIDAEVTPPALQEARADEDLAMQKQYPGEYAAYTESQSTARRTVLAHAQNVKDVHDALAHLTEAEWAEVAMTYCYPLTRPFRGPTRLRFLARTKAEPPAGA